jgi:hypothetical protein
MKKAIQHAVFFLVLYLVLFPQKAEAYLDPGTGSYVLQILMAALFGGLFIVKSGWKEIKHTVSRIFSRKEESASEKPSRKEK